MRHERLLQPFPHPMNTYCPNKVLIRSVKNSDIDARE